jgi:hypothetical protein
MDLEQLKGSLKGLLSEDVIKGMTPEQQKTINKALNTNIDISNIDKRISELQKIAKNGVKN